MPLESGVMDYAANLRIGEEKESLEVWNNKRRGGRKQEDFAVPYPIP
jgi:hypothetical protein